MMGNGIGSDIVAGMMVSITCLITETTDIIVAVDSGTPAYTAKDGRRKMIKDVLIFTTVFTALILGGCFIAGGLSVVIEMVKRREL